MLRPFEPSKDRLAVRRIWRETGWLDHSEAKAESMDRWVDGGRALVAEVNGEAECLVLSAHGSFTYLREQVPMSCITGVTTSRVARKQGFAARLTARAIAEDVAEGAALSGLGMFEQGFYNRIGFGAGAYETMVAFDPAQLNVRARHRPPIRLTKDDWAQVHQARLDRVRKHGQCAVTNVETTRGPMSGNPDAFGLGYRSADGNLTHHFWCIPKDEYGPYRIEWIAYSTQEQFLELMALLKSLGDQVRSVRMSEPAGIQLQDLMCQPFRQMTVTDKSAFAAGIRSKATFQFRICDLAACLAKTHLNTPALRFNLKLMDPIAAHLDPESSWKGAGGDYVVSLGKNSGAEAGQDERSPTLHGTVNAFTRLWMGVRPATGLAITDELSGPQELLEALDETLRLPTPRNDWDF